LYRCECVICADRISSLRSFHAPCGHNYCCSCIVDLAEASTHDESLFPLRCCKRNHFDLDDVAPFLPLDLLALVRKKAVEFGTPSGNRVYCANPNCSAFLGPSNSLQTDILCTQCNTTVCSNCKNTAHPNEACAENAAILEVRALALAEHWPTCPGCHNIIELSQGCFHIICRCRTSFCYLCAALWKTCTCRQWDDDRIEYAAEQRVVNQFGERAMHAAPDIFAERVQQRIAELRINHDCDDHRWRYRHGGGYCNECEDHLPMFMMASILFQRPFYLQILIYIFLDIALHALSDFGLQALRSKPSLG
jgi:IBR domain, a half RING-finger domain